MGKGFPKPSFPNLGMAKVSSPSRKQQQRKPVAADKLRSCYQYSRFVALILVIIVFLLLDLPKVTKYTLGHHTGSSSKSVIPSHEVIDGIDVLWATPQDSNKPPCGILFVAHGCNHAHTDWFIECKQGCLGLPEEVAIVNLALERHLVVVAVSSKNRKSKCWRPDVDGPRVATVLRKISQKYVSDASPLPIWAFGASSGGAFVSALGNFIELRGYLSQIMAVPLEHTPRKDSCMVYLTMENDQMTRYMAEQIVDQAPSNTAEHAQLPPLPISSHDFFSKRIGSVSKAQSKSMVEGLRRGGFLDDQGYLKQDPRQSSWRSAVQPFAGSDTLVADQSGISEVMNVAYSMHEMSREGVAEGLNFCMSLLPSSSFSTCR